MPIIPCENQINCDCNDSPFVNLSSEAPDNPSFFSIGYAYATPLLGDTFDRTSCNALCESLVSQEAADLCAELAALQCVVTDWRTPGPGNQSFPVPPAHNMPGNGRQPFFVNTQQEGTANCADGLPFTYTVPAGLFGGLSQSQADEAAASRALQLAQLHLLCLSNIQDSVCVGTPYSSTITASSQFLAQPPAGDVWTVDGDLPPGLSIPEFISTTGIVTGGVIHLQGTPTTPGVYHFTISIFLSNGDSFSKPYVVKVAGITNGLALPDGQQGQAYNADVNSAGVTNPIYSLEGGALPDGLNLDGGGIIFGTPTVAGDFHFTLGVTEAGTGITCLSPAAITITANGFNWNDQVWVDNPFTPDVAFFTVQTFSGSHAKMTRALNGGGLVLGSIITGNNPNLTLDYEGDPVAANIQVTFFGNPSSPGLYSWEVDFWDNGVPGVDPPTSSFGGTTNGTFNFPVNITGGPGGFVAIGMNLQDVAALPGPQSSVEVTLTPAS